MKASVTQSCPALCDPVDCSLSGCPWDSPGKNTGWVAILFSRVSFRPRDGTQVSCTDRFFTISAIREALVVWNLSVKDPNINPVTLGQNVVFLCGKWC